eukprot:COSAG06_NODE_27_length_32053_cov_79.812950_17_plen_106_part_00
MSGAQQRIESSCRADLKHKLSVLTCLSVTLHDWSHRVLRVSRAPVWVELATGSSGAVPVSDLSLSLSGRILRREASLDESDLKRSHVFAAFVAFHVDQIRQIPSR